MIRKDILELVNIGKSFNDIISIGKNPSNIGFIYETITIICITVKQLIPDYSELSDTNIEDTKLIFKPIKSFRELIDQPICKGDNKSDLNININGKWIALSVKHGTTKRTSDLQVCKQALDDSIYKDDYSLGLVYEDDRFLTKHKRDGNREEIALNIAKKDGYFYNKKDVENAFNNFQKILLNKNITDIDDIIDWIDKEYLHTIGRVNLKLKFNQALALIQFKRNKDESLIHCLNHKPRSGKTIIMLLYAKYLLDNGHKRILIMTSVPETIDGFINELNKYYEFKEINYKQQDNFMDINDEYTGIGFCSVQYLKVGNKKNKKENELLKLKKEKLKLFDCNMFDECHFHSSNKNTYDKIINVHKDNPIMNIFASGTSGKTEWFYNIDKKYIYKWNIEDEAFMKNQYPNTD
tara:strand:- start:3099 stop:4325 length:1227 start_codon:yes stop_codon:yes gene_type:complete